MRRLLETILDVCLGLCELARLGVLTRFRLRGPYWRWRWRTALGPGPKPTRAEIVRRLVRYGVWSRKMRTGRW